MPAPACAGWRASSRSTWPRSRAPARRAGSPRTTSRPSCAARGRTRRRGGRPSGRHGHPGDPGPGLLQVRADRDQAAGAHQAPVRPAPAPLLAQRPARHPRRRGRHHRARGLPQGARRRAGQGEGLPGHAAGLPDEGQRLGAAGLPRVQQLAQPGEGRADLQEATTISASPSTRRKGWWCRWSRTSTARASTS